MVPFRQPKEKHPFCGCPHLDTCPKLRQGGRVLAAGGGMDSGALDAAAPPGSRLRVPSGSNVYRLLAQI